MILKGVEAARYLARPDPERGGLLIFGADPMRVALKRQQALAALIGPEGAAEMRLTRLSGADLRRDPAALSDAIRAKGFFAGARAVLLEEAADGVSKLVASALADWRVGDAHLVVTAGNLAAKSTLKNAFAQHPRAVCIGIYDDPPTRDEIESMLRDAGLAAIQPQAMTDLLALARELDPGDFRQTVEKLGLYKLGDPAPLSSAEVAQLAPASTEAEVDDLIHAVAEGRRGDLAPLLRRLEAQGATPVGLCIGATRHFRSLHRIATGSEAGRPGFNPRREQMQRQAQRWGATRLEEALSLLVETDLTLRSSSRAPGMAVIERALIRLCILR